MNVFGLDLQPSCAGVSILNDLGETVLTKNVTSTHGKEAPIARLMDLHDSLLALVRSFKPELVAVEHYAFGSKFQREASGEIGGVIRLMLHEENTPILEVAPVQLKMFAGLGSKGSKGDIKAAVLLKWGENFIGSDRDHEADAYVLAQLALAYVTDNPLLDYEKKLIQTLRKKGYAA
jgi:Holliday junction resolvasome RuvABC endonuclease subunit